MSNSRIILILAKSFTSGMLTDYAVLADALAPTFECIQFEGSDEHKLRDIKRKQIYGKIFLEHILPQWLDIQAQVSYFVPNHEMLTDWDIKLSKNVDVILCKNVYTQSVFPNNNRLIKFTSLCSHSTAKKDYSLFIHFGGTSFMKGTVELLRYWVDCKFADNKNIKLLITHSPKFNNDVIDYWHSLNPKKQSTFMGRTVVGECYKNMFLTQHLPEKEYNYFAQKAGVRIQPSILEGYGHTVNEGRCNGTLTMTTDAAPMNELITNKKCLFSVGHTIPSYEIFKPFKNLYKYMFRGSSVASFIDKNDFEKKMNQIIDLSDDEKNKIATEQHQQFVEDTNFFKTAIKNIFCIGNTHEKKVFSQNGEDGIIEWIFDTIGTTNKFYVEFGVENGTECNTKYLREKKGWTGLMMDGGNENKQINLQREFIYADNICQLFAKYNVPREFDLLSTDIDYNDFYVLYEIMKGGYRPRAICSEYNAFLGATDDKIVIYDPNMMWDRTQYFGASISAFAKLLDKFEYTIVAGTSIGVNIFFVRNDVLKNCVSQFKDAGNVGAIYRPLHSKYHKPDHHNRAFISSEEAMDERLMSTVMNLVAKVDNIFRSDDVAKIRGRYRNIIIKKDWRESKQIEDTILNMVKKNVVGDARIIEVLTFNRFTKI